MDPNNHRKRDRPHNDEEKVDISSNSRQRTSLVQGLLTQTREDNEAAAQLLMNQARQQLINTAFQMQQSPAQPGMFAMNAELANQQMLQLRQTANSFNPFAGLPGLQGLQQQFHPRTTNLTQTSDLIASLQARIVSAGSGGSNTIPSSLQSNAVAGLFRNQTSPRNSLNASSLSPSQSISLQQFQMPPPASMHPLSTASSSQGTKQEVASSSPVDQQGIMDENTMAILTSCPDNLKLLYTPTDDWKLSPYQCLARRQIEIFEASDKDLEAGAQGRNRPIVMGQVGIRCRWCASQPSRQRQRASAYYPSQLNGIYQAAQNITNTHLSRLCQSVPPVIRDELVRLQAKKSGAGGGKKYWSQSAKDQGVYDVEEGGLRLAPSNSSAAKEATKTDG